MTFTDAKQRALCPGRVIADIGSGIGFLTAPFLKNGNRVCGVEPR